MNKHLLLILLGFGLIGCSVEEAESVREANQDLNKSEFEICVDQKSNTVTKEELFRFIDNQPVNMTQDYLRGFNELYIAYLKHAIANNKRASEKDLELYQFNLDRQITLGSESTLSRWVLYYAEWTESKKRYPILHIDREDPDSSKSSYWLTERSKVHYFNPDRLITVYTSPDPEDYNTESVCAIGNTSIYETNRYDESMFNTNDEHDRPYKEFRPLLKALYDSHFTDENLSQYRKKYAEQFCEINDDNKINGQATMTSNYADYETCNYEESKTSSDIGTKSSANKVKTLSEQVIEAQQRLLKGPSRNPELYSACSKDFQRYMQPFLDLRAERLKIGDQTALLDYRDVHLPTGQQFYLSCLRDGFRF